MFAHHPRFSFLASPVENVEKHLSEPDGNVHDQQQSRIRGPQSSAWYQFTNSSRIDLASREVDRNGFHRYLGRSILNVIGPLLLLGLYTLIVVVYFLRPVVNEISPSRPITGRWLFFVWMVISIFIIDWAKSGSASLEAALLAKSKWWSPSHAKQLLWHADRSWATLNGWVRAAKSGSGYGGKMVSRYPAALWWYLCANSILLYAAIPLVGLSLDTRNTFKTTDRFVTASGANQTTFNYNLLSDDVARKANTKWRTGQATTGEGSALLYAPEGTANVSVSFFEDAIQDIYQLDLENKTTSERKITFFTGPTVYERAHSTVWGLQTSLSCSLVNPLTGLKNMQVRSYANWSGTSIYRTDLNFGYIYQAQKNYSGSQYFATMDANAFGQYSFFLAADKPFSNQSQSDYVNISSLPLKSSLEMVMWQADATSRAAWPQKFRQKPYVHAEISEAVDGLEYVAYGIRCEVESATGFAKIDAATRTFSKFQIATADPNPQKDAKGLLGPHAVVFSALTGLGINQRNFSAPECQSNAFGSSGGCTAWVGINLATKAPKESFNFTTSMSNVYEAITPERAKLAMYKIFGEAVIAMMGSGPTNWQSTLQGLDPNIDIVPGLVPWQIPFALLCVWVLGVVLPTILTFGERRFASTVGGFEMFRLGAEWKEAVIREENDRKRAPPSLITIPHSIEPKIASHEIQEVPSQVQHSSMLYKPQQLKDREVNNFI